jgi:isochorismate synthase EntC
MCGEVICWQCSSTLGVLTINCGPNDASTKQEQLSTNQPTIRVCTKCVVTNHHEKSTKDLASQKEFKEWITNAMIEQRVQEEDQQEKQCSLRNPFLDENIRESSRFQKNSQNISGFCEKDEPFYRLSFSGNQNILNDDYEEKTKAKNKQQDKPEYLYGNMNTLAHPASERDYSATANDDEIYHLSSSNQDEIDTKPTDKVQAASAWASDRNEVIAVSAALQELLYKVGGKVHFLVVGFSPNFKANVIVETLRELAPGIPYIGGTIARGTVFISLTIVSELVD